MKNDFPTPTGANPAEDDGFTVYNEKISVMQRSLRCFAFGLIGLAPVIGLGVGVEAVKLHRAVTAETGETSAEGALIWVGIAAALMAPLLYVPMGHHGIWFTYLVFLAMQLFCLWRCHRACKPVLWNPARGYLQAGIGMAYAGFLASLLIVETILLSTQMNFLLGLP